LGSKGEGEEEEEEDKERKKRHRSDKQRRWLQALDEAREADDAQSAVDFSALVLASISDRFCRKIPR